MYQVWWLMPAQTIFELARTGAEHRRDLLAAMLDAVAEADRIDLAVVDRRPGVHRHRVGVVQEARAGLGDLADVAAEIENDRDVALAVENAAGADRVADALVDAVFQRDLDVVPVGFEAADARAVDDVARAFERLPAVGRGGEPGRQPVGRDHPLEDAAVIIERLRSLMSVSANSMSCSSGTQRMSRHELLREPDAAGADEGDLQAAISLPRRIHADTRAARVSRSWQRPCPCRSRIPAPGEYLLTRLRASSMLV